MSSFTAPLVIQTVQAQAKGWRRLLPPACQRPKWRMKDGFFYAVGSLDDALELIWVPPGFVFDGASVPWLLRLLVPMAHPNYMQATALHDFMLDSRTDRNHCDRVFYEALGVLGMPQPWRRILFAGVKLRTMRRKIEQKIREAIHAS